MSDDTPSGTDSIILMFGNGDGTFKARQYYGSANGPREITAGDFNGDGITDLMTVESTAGGVRVYRGNSNGSFSSGVTYAAGSSPTYAEITDFNGDGIQDALVTLSGENRVVVLQGNGNGTFKIGSSMNVGGGPSALALGDLNGDGTKDIVAANGTGGGISVLTSSSTAIASFAPPTVNLSSVSAARSSLGELTSLRDRIAAERGSIGASMSRLSTAMKNIQVSRENHQAAASRIGDADVAEEVSKLVAQQIRQKFSADMLTRIGDSERITLSLLLGT